MYCLRRTAFRILSSPSTSILTKPRSITTVTPSALRINRQLTPQLFQRRWATGEAEAKAEETEAKVAEVEPKASDPASTSTTIATETAETKAQPESTEKDNSSTVTASISSAAESAATTASQAAESVSQTFGAATNTSSYSGDRRGGYGRAANRETAEPKQTVYVGNLFFDVTERDLQNEMQRFGNVVRTKLVTDNRGLSKGFGYVEFSTIDEAAKAIEGMNQQVFEGRRMTVQYAAASVGNPRGQRNPPTKTLFIGNMSFEMTDRDLNNLFKDIKNVIDVRVAIDRRTGQPRGFAHADFIDVQSAQAAMDLLKNKETYGRKLRVDFSYGSSSRKPSDQAGAQGEASY